VKATRNPANGLTAGTLGAPTAFTASAVGRDVRTAWTAGTNAASTNLEVATSAASSTCSGATWSALASTSATTWLDPRYLPQGTWACYRATSVRSSWTSTTGNPTASAQLGVVASGLAYVNAGDTTGCASSGAVNRLDCGDLIRITFNQPIDTATGPAASGVVCVTVSGQIQLGMGTLCSGTAIATISGTGLAISTSANATATWSSGGTVLTFRLTSTPALSVTIGSPAGTQLQPTTDATKLRSATGAFHVCDSNTGGGACLPTATGSL
jgi:hypothetical protein